MIIDTRALLVRPSFLGFCVTLGKYKFAAEEKYRSPNLMKYNVVILTGGESTGTRFRPLSMKAPKLLFPIAGKSLIEHMIDSLMYQLSAVINEVTLLGFFENPTLFDEFIGKMNDRYPKTPFRYLSEENSKGTAGGLYQYRSLLLGSEGLIFIHGDIICNYPFGDLYDFHQAKNSDALVLGVNPLMIPEFLKKYLAVTADDIDTLDKSHIISNFGTIVSKKNDSKITHYVEKPSEAFSIQYGNKFDFLINGGIYMFKSACIGSLLSKVANSDSISMELDVIRDLPENKEVAFDVFKTNDFWYNLKTPLSALLANNFYLHTMGLPVLSPVEYTGCRIGPYVTIGKNVTIGRGVRIKNSIIGDNVVIGDNSFITNAIITHDVTIGSWCRIEGSVTNKTLCNDITRSHSDGGFKVINNLVVLCENTSVLREKFVFNSIVLAHKDLRYDTKYEIVM